jgi:RND superfamily putative drug exporter
MSHCLYRLAHFAFRRGRVVLAIWLVATIGATAVGVAIGGDTNDNFTISDTETRNAADVLSTELQAFSGGPSMIAFATTNGSANVTEPVA